MPKTTAAKNQLKDLGRAVWVVVKSLKELEASYRVSIANENTDHDDGEGYVLEFISFFVFGCPSVCPGPIYTYNSSGTEQIMSAGAVFGFEIWSAFGVDFMYGGEFLIGVKPEFGLGTTLRIETTT